MHLSVRPSPTLISESTGQGQNTPTTSEEGSDYELSLTSPIMPHGSEHRDPADLDGLLDNEAIADAGSANADANLDLSSRAADPLHPNAELLEHLDRAMNYSI